MISESLKMFLVKKGFFMLDAYVVSWPACAKNLELTLVLATFVGPLVELERKYKHVPKTEIFFKLLAIVF